MGIFPGRLALQQRVCPQYRAAFFDLLAKHCDGGLSVYSGQPLPQEQIEVAEKLEVARLVKGRNWQLFDPSSSFYYCWQGGLVRWLDDWQPQALIVEANPRYLSTPGAVRWMHARGRLVVGWGLGAPPLRRSFAGWRHRSRLRFLKSVDGLIAYSYRGAEEYIQLGMPAERVFVALNAAVPPPVGSPPTRPDGFTGRPMLLFVGRLQKRKRVDLLLQACVALPEEVQPRLVVVGDGPERSALEKMGHAIYPRAEFRGQRTGSDLDELLAEADLFVLPGTGGLALQQAMAAGLPVIAARGDGTQEDLVRPDNGWQVPPDDREALIDAMHTALSDPHRLREMGRASYRLVQEQANIEKMVEVFIQALNSIQEEERMVHG